MYTKKVDVIHSLRRDAPSIMNLRQGLDGTKFDVQYHDLRMNLDNNSRMSKYLVAGSVYPRGIWKYLSLNNDSDLVIIHKPLSQLDEGFLEYLFSSYETTIFSTYDASYIPKPNSTQILSRRVDGILSTSHEISKHYENHKKKTEFIPPSVDTRVFKPMNYGNFEFENDLNDADLVAGWVGNAKQHTIDIRLLLEIFNQLPDDENIALRILPGGDIPVDLESSLNKLEAEVDIVGWVNKNDVPKVINSFDVGLAPLHNSQFNKARSSEKVREYMACGIPVIGSDLGENRYLIPKESGSVVNGVEEWVDELLHYSNIKSLECMGKQAKKHIHENYSSIVVSKKIERFVEQIIEE